MNSQDLKINNLEKKIAEMEKRLSRIEDAVSVGNVQKIEAKNLSIKEFILAKKPKDDTQKMLVIAYFLEKYEGLASFNTKDLASGFERAKEKIPANINDRANKIIGNTGYIMEAREKKDNLKTWTLTNSGERFVDEDLPPKQES